MYTTARCCVLSPSFVETVRRAHVMRRRVGTTGPNREARAFEVGYRRVPLRSLLQAFLPRALLRLLFIFVFACSFSASSHLAASKWLSRSRHARWSRSRWKTNMYPDLSPGRLVQTLQDAFSIVG